MDIYGGIDGTGPYDDQEYARGFAESNVKKLDEMPGWPGGHFYDRGPGADGFSTGSRADRMAANVAGAYRRAYTLLLSAPTTSPGQSREPRIFLAGYSRGGAAVANVAHTLNDQNIPVHCLLLFDAVNRSATIWRDSVAANVQHVYYAQRSPASGSRTSFGNCSLTRHGGGALTPRTFMCTHGAMGGTPWTTAESDGFIHERDVTTESTGALSGGGLAQGAIAAGTAFFTGNLLAGVAAGQLYDSASKTNITLAQETAGNIEVWAWMQENLNIAKRAR